MVRAAGLLNSALPVVMSYWQLCQWFPVSPAHTGRGEGFPWTRSEILILFPRRIPCFLCSKELGGRQLWWWRDWRVMFYSYRVTELPLTALTALSSALHHQLRVYWPHRLATSQPLQPPPALTSVSSASSRLREAQSGQEEWQRSNIPVPAVCLVVDAGRFNDRAEGSWPDQQPQVGSIMFLLFTITLSFTDQTCCYCSHIRAIISLKLI